MHIIPAPAALRYRIEYDTMPENPRTGIFENLFTLYFSQNRYVSGDERIREGHNQHDFEQSGAYLVFPVYAYIHSCVALSINPFSCPWDSGQIGFAVISRADLEKEYGWKRVSPQRWRKLEQYLKNELDEYTAYLNGEVYGYVIETEDGDELESCWGFYDRAYCEQEAESLLAVMQAKENERAQTAA